MWRRKSRFPHGQVDTVPRGFLVVVDHMLDILARVDSEVSIAMPPVCERRLVVHAAVDAVDRCLELVANEPRAHSGSLTLEMAIGGRCDRRRELVAPNGSVDWFLFPHVEGPSILAAILDPTEAADSNTVRLDRSKERNVRRANDRPRDDVRHRRRNRDDTSHRGRSRWEPVSETTVYGEDG